MLTLESEAEAEGRRGRLRSLVYLDSSPPPGTGENDHAEFVTYYQSTRPTQVTVVSHTGNEEMLDTPGDEVTLLHRGRLDDPTVARREQSPVPRLAWARTDVKVVLDEGRELRWTCGLYSTVYRLRNINGGFFVSSDALGWVRLLGSDTTYRCQPCWRDDDGTTLWNTSSTAPQTSARQAAISTHAAGSRQPAGVLPYFPETTRIQHSQQRPPHPNTLQDVLESDGDPLVETSSDFGDDSLYALILEDVMSPYWDVTAPSTTSNPWTTVTGCGTGYGGGIPGVDERFLYRTDVYLR